MKRDPQPLESVMRIRIILGTSSRAKEVGAGTEGAFKPHQPAQAANERRFLVCVKSFAK